MNNFLTKTSHFLQCALLTTALCFLVVPSVSFANQSDRDGDGIPDKTDVCPDNASHYDCLTAAGLYQWAAIASSWTFSARNKMNSIKTCADLNRYVGSFALIRDLSAVLTLH